MIDLINDVAAQQRLDAAVLLDAQHGWDTSALYYVRREDVEEFIRRGKIGVEKTTRILTDRLRRPVRDY